MGTFFVPQQRRYLSRQYGFFEEKKAAMKAAPMLNSNRVMMLQQTVSIFASATAHDLILQCVQLALGVLVGH